MKKIIKIIFACIITGFLIIWLGTLLKCEVLTWLHYDDFAEGYKETNMLGDMEYFKVIECTDDYARVYYVDKNMMGANEIRFCKRDGQWVYDSWETIWSKTGSASEVIWPFWWHFIYGGF